MRISKFHTIVCLKYRSKIHHEPLCVEIIRITEQKHISKNIFYSKQHVSVDTKMNNIFRKSENSPEISK